MVKTITRIGNSQGIAIDKAILEQIGLSVGSKVHVTLSGRSIVLTPESGTMPDGKFEASRQRVNEKYAELFKRLA